jgi:hypothetical protein
MSSPVNAVPDTQLGLTNDEIALLRHHQQAAASGGSSSGAASRASSQGLFLLDSNSLERLSRHFDQLLQQVQVKLDHLSEQSQFVSEQKYDRAANAILHADSEIARFTDILRQIDELEVYFDQIRHFQGIVRSYRQRIDEMEESLQNNTSGRRHSPSSHETTTHSHRQHREVKTEHLSALSQSTPEIQKESDAKHTTVMKLAAENSKSGKMKNDAAEHESRLRSWWRDEREEARADAEIKAAVKVAKEKPPKKMIEFQCDNPQCGSCTHTPLRSSDTLVKHIEGEHAQLFICIFSFAGCQNKFASKKEWKLHVSSQHLNPYYWVCELQDCGKVQMQNRKNDEITKGVRFTESDLFTKHLRTKHATSSVKTLELEKRIQALRISCLRGERHPPECVSCPHCTMNFAGLHCLDEMMDHLAELKDFRMEDRKNSPVFVRWALRERIIQREPNGKLSLCAIKKELGQHGDQSQEGRKVTSLSNDNPGPFSDSGYASMDPNQDINREEVDDDTGSICTDGQELNIEEAVKKKLVAALSRETIQHLHSTLVKLDNLRISMKSIVELLKEFSIRLQFSAKTGQQKDSSVFVRHYRQLVIFVHPTLIEIHETDIENLVVSQSCMKPR